MVLVVQEEHVCLVNYYALQVFQVQLLSSRQELLQLTMSSHHYLSWLVVMHCVCKCDVCANNDLFEHTGNLIAQLSYIDYH